MFGMTSVWNDKCSDRHLFGMTMILLYKYFMTKIFFAPINFQVFLKHLPGHKESIGILGKQIGQWEGSEKSGQTHKNTDIRKLLYGFLIQDLIQTYS